MSYETILDVMASFCFAMFFVMVGLDSIFTRIDEKERTQRDKHRAENRPEEKFQR